MSNNNHWCKGVLEEVQSQSSSSLSSNQINGYSNYSPYNNNSNMNNMNISNNIQTNGTNNGINVNSNDYYRQYCDYYTRYYYSQTQTAAAQTTTSSSNNSLPSNIPINSNNVSSSQLSSNSYPSTTTVSAPPLPTQLPPPPPLPPRPSLPPPQIGTQATQYNPSIPHQIAYTPTPPITYASALLKGQSNWTNTTAITNPPPPPSSSSSSSSIPPHLSSTPGSNSSIINSHYQQNHHTILQNSPRGATNIHPTWPTPAQSYGRKPNPNRFALPNQPQPPSISTQPQQQQQQYQHHHHQQQQHPSTPTSSSTTTTPTNNNTNHDLSPWPKSLKLFVEKSFSQCNTDADRLFVENQLKLLITKITNEGRLHQHKWEFENPPLLPSQQQSQVPSLTSTSISSNSISSTSSYLTTTADNSNEKGNTRDEIKEPKRKKSRFQPIDTTTTTTNNNNNNNPNLQDINSTLPPTPTPTLGSNSKKQKNSIISAELSTKEELNRQNRQNRFMREHNLESKIDKKDKKNSKNSKTTVVSSTSTNLSTNSGSNGLSEFDLESLVVVGTCQKIEKDYLRLTSAPDPSTVRPIEVLKQALNLVTERWNQSKQNKDINIQNDGNSNNKSTTSYVWICSQLKSIRQDVMVQHIKNDFTVLVYEFHGRVALQSGDLNEYNQCQTQLKQLYAGGLKGSEMEFTAYRILYYLYLQGNIKYQKGSQDIAHLMSTLTQEALSDSAVQHALKFRKAIALENYHKIFHLYQITPNYGKCILDKMLDTWRVKALQKMAKAYRPHLEINFILNELVFITSQTEPIKPSQTPTSSSSLPLPESTLSQTSSGIEFITRVGGIITTTPEGEQILDTKLSSISSSSVVAQDDQLLL